MAGHSKWSEIKRQKSGRVLYRATAQPDGPFWFVQVPGMSGVRAQSETLEGAEAAIRQAIALMREIPPDTFDVTVTAVESASPDGE